jgi:hypothetical protein
VQVLDFMHLLVHLYAMATATYRDQGSRGAFRTWRLYDQMLRAAFPKNLIIAVCTSS